MLRQMKVFPRMSIRRRVATADVTTRETESEVEPGGADSQAVFAAISAWVNFANRLNVRVRATAAGRHYLLSDHRKALTFSRMRSMLD
jgi:hypothetical protein